MIRRHRTARSTRPLVLAPLCGVALAAGVFAGSAEAVNYPVTGQQRSTAQQVAQNGVPLSELSPNAPDSHTVRSGDTLWDVARRYVLADNFFMAAFGGSFLNHQYLICACAPEYPDADTAAALPPTSGLPS